MLISNSREQRRNRAGCHYLPGFAGFGQYRVDTGVVLGQASTLGWFGTRLTLGLFALLGHWLPAIPRRGPSDGFRAARRPGLSPRLDSRTGRGRPWA